MRFRPQQLRIQSTPPVCQLWDNAIIVEVVVGCCCSVCVCACVCLKRWDEVCCADTEGVNDGGKMPADGF